MKINSTESFSMNKFAIEDAGKKHVSLKIEAAHAGIVNGNYIFYTPKALLQGSQSLKEFFKPLQKKHFDKTLGYIYDAVFETKGDSPYLAAINGATTPTELGKAVKKYYYSDEYSLNKEGFGVLISKARLYDDEKISKLAQNDRGYVSIAGDSDSAVCSICYGNVVECDHDLGNRYGNEVCFAIADNLELDHISFEDIPANWKTNTLIITDSQIMSKVELIEEGQVMNLSLELFKEKLTNMENVLTELNLSEFLQNYQEQLALATGGEFLFPKEKLLPLNTKLGVIVAKKLLDLLEDGENKDTVANSINKEYTKLFNETTIEEAVAQLVVEVPVVVEAAEDITVPAVEDIPVVVEEIDTKALEVTDADQMILRIVDSLSELVDTKFSDLQSKVESLMITDAQVAKNTIYEDRIEALQQDLILAKTVESQLSSELKSSLLSQIGLLKQVDKESTYFKQLEARSVKELQLTLEDHLALQEGSGSLTFATPTTTTVESTTLEVTDALKPLVTQNIVDVQDAITLMTADDIPNTVLTITDADTVVSKIVEDIGSRMLGKVEYAALYKDTASAHGITAAKKLHAVLKQHFKI